MLMWSELTIILTLKTVLKSCTANNSVRAKSSDCERVLATNARASSSAICHLLWKVSIAKAWFLGMVCISWWACCWCRSCLRRLATSPHPSETAMRELALNMSARTWCWRSPAMLPACADIHCASWLPSMWSWGGWQACATGWDCGSPACSTWPAGTMSFRWLITCYAPRWTRIGSVWRSLSQQTRSKVTYSIA